MSDLTFFTVPNPSAGGYNTVGPTLIATLPYTDFTASTTIYQLIPTTPNAVARTVVLTNDLNLALSVVFLGPWTTGNDTAGNPVEMVGYTAGLIDTSDTGIGSVALSSLDATFQAIAAPTNALMLALETTATAAASGNYYVYLWEMFA